MDAEDIEYNLSDSCFYIKRLVSVAINGSCFNIISLSLFSELIFLFPKFSIVDHMALLSQPCSLPTLTFSIS